LNQFGKLVLMLRGLCDVVGFVFVSFSSPLDRTMATIQQANNSDAVDLASVQMLGPRSTWLVAKHRQPDGKFVLALDEVSRQNHLLAFIAMDIARRVYPDENAT
jgi:hypothetical protein